MGRYRRKKSRHVKAKPSVLSLIPIAYIGANVAMSIKDGASAADTMNRAVGSVTGLDMLHGTPWSAPHALRFVGVLGATYAAKKLVGMAGVNRAMKGLPFRL